MYSSYCCCYYHFMISSMAWMLLLIFFVPSFWYTIKNHVESSEWGKKRREKRYFINEKRRKTSCGGDEGLIEIRGVRYIIPINSVIGVLSRVVSSIRHIANVLEDITVFIHEWGALSEQVKQWNTHSLILETHPLLILAHPPPPSTQPSLVSFTKRNSLLHTRKSKWTRNEIVHGKKLFSYQKTSLFPFFIMDSCGRHAFSLSFFKKKLKKGVPL